MNSFQGFHDISKCKKIHPLNLWKLLLMVCMDSNATVTLSVRSLLETKALYVWEMREGRMDFSLFANNLVMILYHTL